MRTWGLRGLHQFLHRALSVLHLLAAAVSVAFKSRAAIQLENLALRHQLGVLRRSVKRPKLASADRLLWTWLCEVWSDWRSALVIVKPETVISWHRKGFRLFWTWKVPFLAPRSFASAERGSKYLLSGFARRVPAADLICGMHNRLWALRIGYT